MSVTRNHALGTVHLSQEQYINDLVSRFKAEDAKPVLTPMEVGTRLTSDDCPSKDNIDKEALRNYQQMVGSYMYLVAWTHPEISFTVQQLAKYMSNPGVSHIKAAKRVLAYLKGSKKLGLTYKRGSLHPKTLYGYADADHAGDPEGRRSVTGYITMMNGAAVSWQSVRQTVTALSSAEAEYYAASSIGCDIVSLR